MRTSWRIKLKITGRFQGTEAYLLVPSSHCFGLFICLLDYLFAGLIPCPRARRLSSCVDRGATKPTWALRRSESGLRTPSDAFQRLCQPSQGPETMLVAIGFDGIEPASRTNSHESFFGSEIASKPSATAGRWLIVEAVSLQLGSDGTFAPDTTKDEVQTQISGIPVYTKYLSCGNAQLRPVGGKMQNAELFDKSTHCNTCLAYTVVITASSCRCAVQLCSQPCIFPISTLTVPSLASASSILYFTSS